MHGGVCYARYMANHIPLKNRQNQTFYARLTPGAGRFAVIQHGLTGSMDQPHIKALEKAYQDSGYTTLSIDCTNTLNLSDGSLEAVSVGQHCDDLADAIAWLRAEHRVADKIALAGHSMGGFSVLRYAEDHADEIDHVLGSAVMTSGINLFQAWRQNRAADLERWRAQGYWEFTSSIDPTRTGRAPWSMWSEFTSHTIFDGVANLTMPTYFVNGDADISTPLTFLERFYKQVPERKELHIIKDADHSYTQPDMLSEFSRILGRIVKAHDG